MADFKDIVETIPADSLTAEYALVSPKGGVLVIEGDVESSSALPGCMRIETGAGAVYIDEDEFIDVIDLTYGKAQDFEDFLPRGVIVHDGLFAVDSAKVDGFGPNGELFMRVQSGRHVFNFGLNENVRYVR